MWKIGDEAIFNCDPRYYNYTIPPVSASNVVISKYSTWKQLDKKRVVVCQIINTTLNTYKVYLKDDGPQFQFSVDGPFLSKAGKAPSSGCTCSNQTLMIRGCACGHFTKETKTVPLQVGP